MIKRTLYFLLLSLLTWSVTTIKPAIAGAGIINRAEKLYIGLQNQESDNLPSEEVFQIAFKGYQALKSVRGSIKKEILTIIDFSLPSTEKRMWIIDLASKNVLFNDYVAHGRNSGDNEAVSFSNLNGSHMSSIGFFLTAETYFGKHGLSLRLEGMDDEYNSNARSRAIVMHGADYVSADFIQQHGRLGRSLGCPSVSKDIHEDVIETIKEGTTLFIYYPDSQFLKHSKILNQSDKQRV